MHWSADHIGFLRDIVPELAHVPLYLLTASESGAEWQANWQAAFSPLGDLKARGPLESLGLWSGRGACIMVRSDFDQWSARCQHGTLLHELSHSLEHLAAPDALASLDSLSPIARELLHGDESTLLADAGICATDLIRGQHGSQFVRLSMHLYWRSRQRVVISPSDVQFLATTYSLSPVKYDAVQAALSSELAMSHNLNLLRLREAPAEFLALFS